MMKQFVLSRIKKKLGEIQFKVGLAVLQRSQIDVARRNPYYAKILSYERRESMGNPYHGNILMKSTASKQDKRKVADFLAVGAKVIYRNEIWEKTPPSSADIKAMFPSDVIDNE